MNYPISIPNSDPPLDITVHDSITITFTSDNIKFVCSDENEFYDPNKHKYIRHGTFNKNDTLYGEPQNPEEFWYGFDDGKQASERRLQAGVRTIVVSSTTPFLGLASLEETLKSDPPLKELFCKCWPCAESLLKALVEKLPIPAPVKAFLEHLFDIGDKAYKKLCSKPK